jgi:uncharacterized protein YbaR (Trm112 family)
MKSCQHLNKILKDRYGLDLLAGPLDHDHLQQVYEHYRAQRSTLRLTLGESAMGYSTAYSKAYLISEAALMILKEIAPKRRKKKESK